MSCKNFPFHLVGCTLFLFVGARTQSVKAVLPDPSVVEAHWRRNPKIFQETFEVLFPKAEQLHFWSEEFPHWFKEQNGNLYKARTASGDLSFHTLDDLEKLSCDADLKKIIKVVGSREFLAKVLPEEVMQSIVAYATGGEEFKTRINFIPHFGGDFFNMFGKGELKMMLKQSCDMGEGLSVNLLSCDFTFAFEKKNPLTVLRNYDVFYGTQGSLPAKAEFLKKAEGLPCFPLYAVRDAKKKFPIAYTVLRNRFKNDSKLYRNCKICSGVEGAKERLKESICINDPCSSIEHSVRGEDYTGESVCCCFDSWRLSICSACPAIKRETPSPDPLIKKYGKAISAMLDVIVTEDFLKEIFGETFWNILEHWSTNWFTNEGLSAKFDISPCNGGLKVSYSFKNAYAETKRRMLLLFRAILWNGNGLISITSSLSFFTIRKRMKFHM